MTLTSFSYRRLGALLLALALAAPSITTARDDARQQADIAALIQELDYLIDYTEKLAHQYRADRASVTFNYAALLEQLRTTRARSADYLNERHTVVQAAPSPPANATLARRR